MKKIAVIDLGSNSVRMSIFSPEHPQKPLKAYRSTIRLSEGMTTDGLLQAKPQMRAVNALLEYKSILEGEGITTICAVATAAVRKAKNQKEFLDLVKTSTGIEIKVIDGQTEAALDSLAVSRTLGCSDGIICDIGGGSTELIGICQGETPMISIPHGSRGICEMFLERGEAPVAIEKAQAFADKLTAEAKWLSDFKNTPLVGIGGTLRALAKYNLSDISSSAIEGCEISSDRMQEIFAEIQNADIEARTKMAGIGAERADIILGGIILLKSIINHLTPSKIIVSDVGVREGVFFDHIENSGIL